LGQTHPFNSNLRLSFTNKLPLHLCLMWLVRLSGHFETNWWNIISSSINFSVTNWHLDIAYIIMTFVYLVHLVIILLKLLKCSLSESNFINSVQDATNFNPQCHIHILMQVPFHHSLTLKNPSTIRTLSKNSDQNKKNLSIQNSSISVVQIRGINCIYGILLQIHKFPTSNSTINRKNDILKPFQSIPFEFIDDHFLSIKGLQGYPCCAIYRITYMIIFTRISPKHFSAFEGAFTPSVYLLYKAGFVLLLDADFIETTKPISKPITHIFCLYCIPSPPLIRSGFNISLKSLSHHVEYIQNETEKEFVGFSYFAQSIAKTALPHPLKMSSLIYHANLLKLNGSIWIFFCRIQLCKIRTIPTSTAQKGVRLMGRFCRCQDRTLL